MTNTKIQQEFTKLSDMKSQLKRTVLRTNDCVKQLSENKLVKEDLERLEDGAKVFKLIGPALVKVELKEAKENVDRRIQYLTDEKKRYESKIKELQEQQEKQVETVQKLEMSEKAAAQKAAQKS